MLKIDILTAVRTQIEDTNEKKKHYPINGRSVTRNSSLYSPHGRNRHQLIAFLRILQEVPTLLHRWFKMFRRNLAAFPK